MSEFADAELGARLVAREQRERFTHPDLPSMPKDAILISEEDRVARALKHARFLKELEAELAVDLNSMSEDEVREHWGYTKGETRTRAERQATADRIMGRAG